MKKENTEPDYSLINDIIFNSNNTLKDYKIENELKIKFSHKNNIYLIKFIKKNEEFLVYFGICEEEEINLSPTNFNHQYKVLNYVFNYIKLVLDENDINILTYSSNKKINSIFKKVYEKYLNEKYNYKFVEINSNEIKVNLVKLK